MRRLALVAITIGARWWRPSARAATPRRSIGARPACSSGWRPITWKVAAAGGAALGLGIGGFVLNDDDPSFQQVRDVELQSARDSISSLSSPIKVAPPTTVAEASVSPVAPAPPAANDSARSAQSAASPAPAPKPAPAPAPAPVYDDSASADSPVQPSTGGGGGSASFSGPGSSS